MSPFSPDLPQSAPFAGRRQFVRQTLAVSSAARFSGRIRANGSEGGVSRSTTSNDIGVEVSRTDGWEAAVVTMTAPLLSGIDGRSVQRPFSAGVETIAFTGDCGESPHRNIEMKGAFGHLGKNLKIELKVRIDPVSLVEKVKCSINTLCEMCQGPVECLDGVEEHDFEIKIESACP